MIIRPQHDSSCKKLIHRANVNPRAKLVPTLRKMVPPARFQRATSRLGGERSMQLSYGSKLVNGKRVLC